MIVLIPLNARISNKMKALQSREMQKKDERIKVVNELLNGIKVLKLYAWEPSFAEKVLQIRDREMKVLEKTSYYNAAASFTWSCAPYFVRRHGLDVSALDINLFVFRRWHWRHSPHTS